MAERKCRHGEKVFSDLRYLRCVVRCLHSSMALEILQID
jgi:hypothetical protein